MKMSISRSIAMRSASCVALVAAGLWSCAAFAQAAPAETPAPADTQASAQGDTAEQSGAPTGLGDIIVTARRQSENLQRVPVTVTALSGDQLQRQNVVAPSDLQFAAPSVTVQAELGRLGGSYTVRGVNAGTITYFAEAPGGPTAIRMPFFDEASVQILNGPQGTLFGRTAAAGAVLITPKRPDLSKTGGSIDIDVGNYGRLMGTGVLNVPIIKMNSRSASSIIMNMLMVSRSNSLLARSSQACPAKSTRARTLMRSTMTPSACPPSGIAAISRTMLSSATSM